MNTLKITVYSESQTITNHIDLCSPLPRRLSPPHLLLRIKQLS